MHPPPLVSTAALDTKVAISPICADLIQQGLRKSLIIAVEGVVVRTNAATENNPIPADIEPLGQYPCQNESAKAVGNYRQLFWSLQTCRVMYGSCQPNLGLDACDGPFSQPVEREKKAKNPIKPVTGWCRNKPVRLQSRADYSKPLCPRVDSMDQNDDVHGGIHLELDLDLVCIACQGHRPRSCRPLGEGA